LAALTKTVAFQQVFGVFVNTSGGAFSTAEKTTLNIGKATLTNILNGTSSDWSDVPDMTGNAIASSPEGIVVVDREAGSGSRTAASVYFTNDECISGVTSLADTGPQDYFSTGDVLAAANTIPGSITYATIDNAGSFANLTLVSINGVVPSNLAAAEGQYDFWYEAFVVSNPAVTTPAVTTFQTFLANDFQKLSTAPHVVDILAIPGKQGNTPKLPVSASASAGTGVSGTATIYVNPFTRSGGVCTAPQIAL
jgi:hypothetical protein